VFVADHHLLDSGTADMASALHVTCLAAVVERREESARKDFTLPECCEALTESV